MAHSYLSAVRFREVASRDSAVDADAIGIIVDVYGDGAYEVDFRTYGTEEPSLS